MSEWQAYYAIEPFGEERADIRTAINTAAIVNHLKAKGTPAKVEDFLPFWEKPEPTGEGLRSKMAAMFPKRQRGTGAGRDGQADSKS